MAPATPNALGMVQASNALARAAQSAELPGQASPHPRKLPHPPGNGADRAKNGRDAPGNGRDPTGSAGHPPAAGKPDPFAEWPTLRHQIRAAMAERGVDFERLGGRLGYAADTLQQAIGTNKPKTRRMAERLGAWLEDPDAAAEAPAEPPAPFRARAGAASGGASAGNGAAVTA